MVLCLPNDKFLKLRNLLTVKHFSHVIHLRIGYTACSCKLFCPIKIFCYVLSKHNSNFMFKKIVFKCYNWITISVLPRQDLSVRLYNTIVASRSFAPIYDSCDSNKILLRTMVELIIMLYFISFKNIIAHHKKTSLF
jgi:hypothetical protein